MSTPPLTISTKRELQTESDDGLLGSEKRLRLETPPASNSTVTELAQVHQHTATTERAIKQRVPKITKRGDKLSKRQRRKLQDIEPCSHDDVYWQEVIGLVGQETVDAMMEAGTARESPFGFKEEVNLVIQQLSSNGEGLALVWKDTRPWIVIVPFTLPGETVRARVYRNSRLHSFADLISIVSPNSDIRNMSLVQCKYFGQCAGCQYQMLSYEGQLNIKRDVVVRAYHTFSDLSISSVPEVLPTAPSPLQYGYRTKITPHFDAPRRASKHTKRPVANAGNENENSPTKGTAQINIGFNQMGKKQVMDIEECPIATPILNDALGPIRENIKKNIHTYKKGVSLLLRDSLEIPQQPTKPAATSDSTAVETDVVDSAEEKHVCMTDHRAMVRERVGDTLFEFPGGSFFQNNNSVLMPLMTYVKDAIFTDSSATNTPTHLVDAYCGSGFFSIMLSPYFSSVAGIELSQDSIASAISNARLNNIPPDKCTFRAGDASAIFDSVQDFPAERTALIIDPPRKGCDQKFIDQLLAFKSSIVVYVSCNVHTQARDVGMIIRGSEQNENGKKYELVSVRGFDLFPQTAHVESVAVLKLC